MSLFLIARNIQGEHKVFAKFENVCKRVFLILWGFQYNIVLEVLKQFYSFSVRLVSTSFPYIMIDSGI